jgi:predicted SprT family Zn-dependent metalloprotease
MKRQVHVKSEIRKAFEAKFVETLAKAKPHHGKDIPLIPLYFLACGGKAGYFRQQFIAINPDYFTKPGGYEEMLNVTLPHEVAHYITRFLYGIDRKTVKSHGWQWAQVMGWIGLPPTRCHQMDSEGIVNRHERPYKYQCGPRCMVEHLFTARKHIKAQQLAKLGGRNYYFCKKCRTRLVYAGLVHNGHFTSAAKPTPALASPLDLMLKVLDPKSIQVTVYDIKPAPVVATTPPMTPEPKPTHKTVTRWIGGMLQNTRVPIEEGA